MICHADLQRVEVSDVIFQHDEILIINNYYNSQHAKHLGGFLTVINKFISKKNLCIYIKILLMNLINN